MYLVNWLVYRFVKWFVFRPFFNRTCRFEVLGEDNLPERGGYSIACNHGLAFDPVVLPVILKPQISFATKIELYSVPGLKWILVGTGMTPLKRKGASFGELKKFRKQAESVMHRGLVFGIFPEGTRSRNGKLLQFEPGTGFIASATGCLVVPIGLSYYWKWQKLRRPVIRAVIGEPLDGSRMSAGDLTKELRNRIAHLSGKRLVENVS